MPRQKQYSALAFRGDYEDTGPRHVSTVDASMLGLLTAASQGTGTTRYRPLQKPAQKSTPAAPSAEPRKREASKRKTAVRR